MSWDGSIYRHILGFEPAPGGRTLLHFECNHTQESDYPPEAWANHKSRLHADRFEAICDTCSAAQQARTGAYRRSIDFSDVLEQLRKTGLGKSEEDFHDDPPSG